MKYWINRNKSKAYSIKLNTLFKLAIKLIAEHPKIGKLTEFPNVRAKIVRDYYIFYQETDQEIHVLTVWDTRQNPEKLKERMS
ncbi:MAG: type II toxin-antitoxin system RelE/ParE family toxin [Bacteroidia bacterium]